MPLPYESARLPAPTSVLPGHVSQPREAAQAAFDGLRVAPPRPAAPIVARAAFVAVSAMPRPSMLLAGPASSQTRPPELGDDGYVGEVFGRPAGTTEADLEQELMAAAAALGVELPESGWNKTDEPMIVPAGDAAADTPGLRHNRAASAASDRTADTKSTAQTSDHTGAPLVTTTSGRRRSRTLSFSQYDKYISQLDPSRGQLKTVWPVRGAADCSEGVVIKPGSRKGVKGFTRSLANKLRRRRLGPSSPMPCICCREDFTINHHALHMLPCGHSYCRDCLCVMVSQSLSDECKMPPRCCAEPIPSAIIKLVLPRDKQQQFLKAVVQFSTPWEARVFCPKAGCGEFIPPAAKVDPKQPSEALCAACRTRVCTMCKRDAHQLGQDCPEDRELEGVLRMGERSGWRRCYKCRTLVELAQGCTHITCRCKAQFCYICGAVWDPAVGCPNFCNGEEELERRRAEEEARLAEMEAEKIARERAAEAEEVARREAEARTLASGEYRALRRQQEEEMRRFREYERKLKRAMRSRQAGKKRALTDKFADLTDRMRERHAKTEQHLEDRQVLAEIELQEHLEEKEKKVRIKLKHMEDYCHGHGVAPVSVDGRPEPAKNNNDSSATLNTIKPDDKSTTTTTTINNPPAPPDDTPLPRRQVTPRDLEQLRQQYCVRDGMTRRHASLINGLREKQAKSMEELVARHEAEMASLMDRHAGEVEDLAARCADEEEVLALVFAERRARLVRRWGIAAEVVRVGLERREGGRFGEVGGPVWVEEEEEEEEGLEGWEVRCEDGCGLGGAIDVLGGGVDSVVDVVLDVVPEVGVVR